MFEYVDVGRLDAAGALDVLEQAQLAKRQAEVTEALAMLRVVQTYRHQIATDKVRLAADGTGLVDDFACLELAAALHRTTPTRTTQHRKPIQTPTTPNNHQPHPERPRPRRRP